MPVCSGLSALIQAATSQLGDLIESDASELSHPSPHNQGDGYASSTEGDWRSSTPTWTPNMVPEDAKTIKTSFPEQLMSVLVDPANIDVITFLPDGKFFAIRVEEFSEDILHQRFQLSSFEEFLESLLAWGFVPISSEDEQEGNATDEHEKSIQVFRHPYFHKGGPVDLRHVRFSASHNPALPKMPDKPNIEYSVSDDSSITSAKRRLSPSHVDRDFEVVTTKQRALSETDTTSSHENDHLSVASALSNGESGRPARRRSSIENRSKALAVTAAQLSLEDGQLVTAGTTKAERRASLSLVDGGVDKATHNIVASAIESLLFDESHTRQMYLKHEKELSKSSLPGVVPISKQLFSPQMELSNGTVGLSRHEQIVAVAKALHPIDTHHSGRLNLSHKDALAVSPTQLQAATALVKQAGIKNVVLSGQPVTGAPT